jgi:hypothetical protein
MGVAMVERSISEKADYLSRKRARTLPALVIIFLSQQATYVSMYTTPGPHSAETVKISAWLVLSSVLLAAIATKGFWFQPREVRELIDDEVTRANRMDAMRYGFIFGMLAAIAVYILTMVESVSAREAVHIVLSLGVGASLVRLAVLERRAHRDG